MTEVESLILEASVVDDFSRTLDELKAELAQVDQIEADPDVDVDGITNAMAEVELLKRQLNSLDSTDANVDVDTDTDADTLQGRIQRAGGMGSLAAGEQTAKRFAESIGMHVAEEGDPMSLRAGSRDLDNDEWRDIFFGDQRGLRFGTKAQTVSQAMDMPNLFGRDRDTRSPLRRLREELSDNVRQFSKLRASMGMFMNLMASLIPLAFVFIGALPAAIAGVTALAAASVAAAAGLGGVAALGLGAMLFEGGELNVAEAEKHLEETLDVLLESFMPLMEALKPVAESLFRNFQIAARDIAAHMNVLLAFTNDAIGTFQWLADVAGPALQDLVMFGHAAVPLMQTLIGGLANIEWFEIFADILADTLPALADFAGFIMTMLPGLYKLSLGFLDVAVAVTGIFTAIFALIDALGPLGKMIGAYIGLTLTAVTASFLWSRITGSVATQLGTFLFGALQSAYVAIQTYLSGMMSATAATVAALAAVTALTAALTLGLAPALSAIMGSIAGVNNDMSDAVESFKNFDSASATIEGRGAGSAYGSGMGYGSPGAGTTIVAPDRETGMAVANTVDWQNSNGGGTTDSSDKTNDKHSG